VSVQLLTLLKFCLLALIYLFFFRVLRAVWAEITPPKAVAAPVGRTRAPKQGKPAKVAAGPATRPSRPEPTGNLVVLEPAELRGRTYSLGAEITDGRAPGCSVMVDDTFVSQVHARVFQREGNYLVEDLGSTNGTYLNKKKLSGTMMMHRGDRLQVGNTVLELE
jgi:pSer/pThr/pTyr-binding forkhead associated (FHA) protein